MVRVVRTNKKTYTDIDFVANTSNSWEGKCHTVSGGDSRKQKYRPSTAHHKNWETCNILDFKTNLAKIMNDAINDTKEEKSEPQLILLVKIT